MSTLEKGAVMFYLLYLAVPSTEWLLYSAVAFASTQVLLEMFDALPQSPYTYNKRGDK